MRAQCQACGARFGARPEAIFIACPWCHTVQGYHVEPADEQWWTWMQKQSDFGEIKTALASMGRAVANAGGSVPAVATRRPVPPVPPKGERARYKADNEV